jgi:MFS family permease
MNDFTDRTFSSLKIRNFRLYFIGQSVSVMGNFMQAVAQSWLVLSMTHSGTALGLVTALQYLPILLFGVWGGVVADRYNKRNLLLATQGIMGILALVLGILVVTNTIQLWMVYILALLLGVTTLFDNPARQAFVMEMVGPSHLRNAITLYTIELNIDRVIGPVVAGILILTVGIGQCFIWNALTFIPLLVTLIMMRKSEMHAPTPVKKAKGQMMEGVRYIFTKRSLLHVIVMMALIGTLTYEFVVSLPLLAQVTFHGDADVYAALTAAIGVGAVFGGLLTASRSRASPGMLPLAALLFGVAVLIASFMPNVLLSLAAMVLVGIFSIYFTSLANTVMQLESDANMRGRVMAFWSISFLGSTAIGAPVVGFVGETFGPRWGLAIGGIAAVVAAIYGMFALEKDHGKVPSVEIEAKAESIAEHDTRMP